MLTLCIRYTIDRHRLAEFERYARAWPGPMARCGGRLLGYWAPTKIAGPTDIALALIEFADLAAYGRYRDALAADPEAMANVAQMDADRCILVEDRSILRRVPAANAHGARPGP